MRISGYASLWGVADLNGDVVARGAFAESLKRSGPEGIKMLWQHGGEAIIGTWERVVEDQTGLWVEGLIGDWSPLARMARAVCRAKAVDGLSIGYRTARARREGRLRVLSGVELWEVSVVTFPACPGARLRVVRPEAA